MAYSNINKNQLPVGEWINDINKYPKKKYKFISDDGYKCYILRNKLWVYCVYVILPLYHNIFKFDDNQIKQKINIHGGIKYINKDNGILGFDFANLSLGDISPVLFMNQENVNDFNDNGVNVNVNVNVNNNKKYWNFNDCMDELFEFSRQLKDME